MPLVTENLEIAGVNATSAYDLPKELGSRDEVPREISEIELESLIDWLERASEMEGFSGEFKRHTNGTYTHKKALLESLYCIYESLKASREEGVLAEESKNASGMIATLLSEGIKNCTPGFHNRVNLAVEHLKNNGRSIGHLLFKYRVSLVEKAFNKKSNDVHVYNRFFCVANLLGLGVRTLSLDDVYLGGVSDNDIKKVLFSTFETDYTPLNIFAYLLDSIKSVLTIQHGYIGRDDTGYVEICFEGWLLFLKVLLEENEEDYELLLTEENSNVIDLDWGKLSKKILSYLARHNIYSFDASSEDSLIHDFFLSMKADETVHKLVVEKKYILFSVLELVDAAHDEAKERALKILGALLICAAKRGDKETVLALINRDANLDMADKGGNTAFMVALKKGYEEIASALVKKNVKLDVADENGNTTLMMAVLNDLTQIALFLIKNNVRLDAVDEDGNTALILAAMKGYTDIVLALIKRGVDINATNRANGTALCCAAQEGQKETVLALIQNNADMDIKYLWSKDFFYYLPKEIKDDVRAAINERHKTTPSTPGGVVSSSLSFFAEREGTQEMNEEEPGEVHEIINGNHAFVRMPL